MPVLSSCLTGGGRFQDKMCQGKPLYDEPVQHWQAADGARITCCRWLPPKGVSRKGVVIAIPGMDEASAEWAQLGRYLAARGYEVYASDLRGQGRDFATPGRGNYHHWQQWLQDVNEFAAQMLHGRKLPVAYIGHSLGGMVALSAASAAKPPAAPAALVLYSPAFALAYPSWFVRPLTATAQIVTLNSARVTGPAALKLVDKNVMSNCCDEAAWERSTDRLCKGFTYRYVNACFGIGRHAGKLPAQTTTPVLLEYGRSDATIAISKRSPEQILNLFRAREKELWWHPDCKANHDMLNDRLVRKEMLEKTRQWLDQKLGNAARL